MDKAGDNADRALRESQRLYRRYMSAWAMDVLALRRAGLDRPRRQASLTLPPAAPLRKAA